LTKYTVASERRRQARREQHTPAIWRGIGCLMIVIVPIISYLLAAVSLDSALQLGWPIPYQLLGNPVMPAPLWSVVGLIPVLAFVEGRTNLYAILVLTLVYAIAFSALISLIYAVVYRFMGPARYGPVDAPPPKIKVRTYKR
jgi:uncharacterized SAM-binding protein YcdF (DUF218 family)